MNGSLVKSVFVAGSYVSPDSSMQDLSHVLFTPNGECALGLRVCQKCYTFGSYYILSGSQIHDARTLETKTKRNELKYKECNQ